MNWTVLLLLALLCMAVVSILLWAAFLRIGLLWAQVEGVTKWRVIRATLIIYFLQLMLPMAALWMFVQSESLRVIAAIVALMATFVVPAYFIARSFRIKFWRAFKAWLPTFISTGIMWLLCAYLIRPYVFEAFSIPTNSMAPTILGEHLQGECAVCGGPAFGSPDPVRPLAIRSTQMICEKHFHLSRVPNVDPKAHDGDRILVAKFSQPERWDVIVFRFPSQPETLYVKRLVGLPGELIEIKEGAVWADGKQLEPPDQINEIEYLSEMPGWLPRLWGTTQRPAKLGPDEYFVLGDFSAAALDSRFWEQGDPGHNPFAVPTSYLHGVVTHIYWPPSRWRALQ